MGKKGRKTRWRRLPIGGTEEEGGISLEPADQKSTEEKRITFNEDEYTKITTPRQDVLFKKGYFGRKRVPNTADVQEVHSTDSVESETYVNEEPQYVYAAPAGYVDHTGAVYYVNSNSYETYDPYTGTVTVVVGPPPQFPPGNHPVLAAIPCQPVPLQPLEWFNPPAPWCYSYARRKRYSTDSQNCSAQSSESTGPPGSPQELLDEGAGAVFPPQQYVYPGYMFGAPMYNMNGVTVQGVIPQTQAPPVDLTANKRRKKRRRRRRGGVTDEGSESSCEEPLSCEATGSQSGASSDVNGSHSGASSDAGPGSSCSKANSDSGINTDPTPNSGTNSPPINICHDHIDVAHIDKIYSENSLPSSLVDVNELINYSQFNSHVGITLQDTTGTQAESINTENAQILIKQPELQESCTSTNIEILSQNEAIVEDVIVPVTIVSELNLCSEQENLTAAVDLSPEDLSISSCINTSDTIKESSIKDEGEDEEIEQNSETLQELSCGSEVTESPDIESLYVDSTQICSNTVNGNFDNEEFEIITSKNEIHSDSNIFEILKTNTQVLKEDQLVQDNITSLESLRIDLEEEKVEEEEEVADQNNITNIPHIEICEESLNSEGDLNNTMERKGSSDSEETELTPLIDANRIDEVSMKLSPEQPFSRFSSCRDVSVPIPPPRRKRSMSRAAEKTALKVVDNAVHEGMKEAACLRCKQQHFPITEAVTRWLNSQGSSALSCDDFVDYEEDEGIEEGEGSTDPKNVYGNPFLVSSVNDSRTRVADDCASFESSAGEWDMWDHTRAMCDATQSVDKYYRLSVEEVGLGEKKPPSVIKTAVHIRHSGPFPCGVCCIIQ